LFSNSTVRILKSILFSSQNLHSADNDSPDSCDETGVESIVSETKEQAALADTTVADEQQLD